ncbi:MAG TPA: acyl-CoA reductase [Candidatus Limnocylindria bacterium]|nr:acyl-CoA reductase [Candidatus Limnocylindria bacterium]
MNLPNYFIADLPREHAITPTLVTEACQTLKRNREHYLAGRATSSIVGVLSATAQSWLESNNPFRQLALARGVAETGFSEPTLARGLDSFFKQFTADNLNALIAQDLGHIERLDRFTTDRISNTAALARGPELLVHIAAGNIPNPAIFSIVLGFLTRSAQFVKCARETSLLPRLFAHSIYELEPKLASCLEIAEWPGGTEPFEQALFAEADYVTATGSDETLSAIRTRLPARTRFIGYGHRVSLGYITSDALARYELKKTVQNAAKDVAAWDQLGCLSPHVLYVEHGSSVSAEQFAEMLANEFATIESREPRGKLLPQDAAAIALKRSFYEVRSAAAGDVKLWQSENSTAWTVVYEADPQFQISCLNRFVYVKSASDLTEALRYCEPLRGQVSTVGLAASGDRAQQLATQLARWGVTRVCRLGEMQNPPLTWRHDGRPALGDLITWTDWES